MQVPDLVKHGMSCVTLNGSLAQPGSLQVMSTFHAASEMAVRPVIVRLHTAGVPWGCRGGARSQQYCFFVIFSAYRI